MCYQTWCLQKVNLMLRRVHSLPVAVVSFALASCGGWAPVDSSSTAVSVVHSLPAPDVTTDAADFSNYRIGPSDDLSIDVFGAPDLKRGGQVDGAGNFLLPLVGNIN